MAKTIGYEATRTSDHYILAQEFPSVGVQGPSVGVQGSRVLDPGFSLCIPGSV